MKTSENIKELLLCLSKAQKEISPVIKDGESHFSKYATLNSVLNEVNDKLLSSSLCLIQMCTHNGLTTRISHIDTGQWIEDTAIIDNIQNDVQKYGSLITYLRRYSIKSLFLMQDIDDDGDTANGITDIKKHITDGYNICVKENYSFNEPLEAYLSGDTAKLNANFKTITNIYKGIKKSKGGEV